MPLGDIIKNKGGDRLKIIDLHNHTKYSYDGHNTAREIIENAVRNRVDIIAVTDHQFSIGDKIGDYIKEVNELKTEFKDKIKVLCGLEIGTRPKPTDFPPEISKLLDFCLFESLDSKKGMDIYEFIEWRRLFLCPSGLAHTDIFALSERYKTDIIKLLKHENIFWEINFSGNYDYYFDFITNKEKQRMVSESKITLSVGSDTHWIGDFDKKRLVQTNALLERLKNPVLTVN